MEEQVSQMANLQPQLIGRGLLPEEVAENKQKGRDLSRLVRKGQKKNLTLAEVEDRREKNRLRQARFREKQKSREAADEEARSSGAQYQNAALDQSIDSHMAHDVHPHHGYPSEGEMGYRVSQQDGQPPLNRAEASRQVQVMEGRAESMAEKRKRQGRERQARFRERKRSRSIAGRGPNPPHIEEEGGPDTKYEDAQMDGMTLADLQKLSAQLSGYYIGLTQNLSHDEHQAVMRFFLEGLREDLGDELVGGVATYVFADAQAQAAAAAAAQVQAQYLQQGISQGIDLHNLHALQAAIAAAQMPQQDVQGHIHSAQMGAEQQVGQESLQSHMEHMNVHPAATQAASLQGAQMEYHRGLSEQQDPKMMDKAGNPHTDVGTHQAGQLQAHVVAGEPSQAEPSQQGLQEVAMAGYRGDAGREHYREVPGRGDVREPPERNEYAGDTRSQAWRNEASQEAKLGSGVPVLHEQKLQQMYGTEQTPDASQSAHRSAYGHNAAS